MIVNGDDSDKEYKIMRVKEMGEMGKGGLLMIRET